MKCPYCNGEAVLTSSKEVYNGRDYGPIYLCRPCRAYVGCHKGTTTPLGRLANAELREWKKRAHAVFDPIWQERFQRKGAIDPNYKKAMARGGRYKKLAALMDIPIRDCHIGMFDVEQCQQVVNLCASGQLEDPDCGLAKTDLYRYADEVVRAYGLLSAVTKGSKVPDAKVLAAKKALAPLAVEFKNLADRNKNLPEFLKKQA